MFHILRLAICFILLVTAQAETHFIRGEKVNPSFRLVNVNHEKALPPLETNGLGHSSTSRFTETTTTTTSEFHAVKRFSGSKPMRLVA
jgi:hypothetical protein